MLKTIYNLFADVALAASALVAILAFVDWCMSDKQRTAFQDRQLALWNWLDDRNENYWQIIQELDQRSKQKVLLFISVILCGCLMAVLEFFGRTDFDWLRFFFPIIVSAAIFVRYSPEFLLAWLSRAKSWDSYYARSLVALFAYHLAILPLIVGMWHLSFRVDPGSWSEFGLILLVGIFFGPVYAMTFLPIAYLIAAGAIQVGKPTLFVGEFVMRRIAENPKGPVLGISVIVAAIASAAKGFQ